MRLRPIHMNTMEFHSVVAKSIFGAKLSNVNKPISRISDVIFFSRNLSTKLKFVLICFSRWHNMVPNQCSKFEGHDYEGMASTIKISCDFDENT